jgi:hypothetical protein
MSTLYLSEAREPPEPVDPTIPGDDYKAAYLRAREGVLGACQAAGWSVVYGFQLESIDDIAPAIRRSQVFFGLLVPFMRTNTRQNWELARSVREPAPVGVRRVLLFKARPTTDPDDITAGFPGVSVYLDDADGILAELQEALRARAG